MKLIEVKKFAQGYIDNKPEKKLNLDLPNVWIIIHHIAFVFKIDVASYTHNKYFKQTSNSNNSPKNQI